MLAQPLVLGEELVISQQQFWKIDNTLAFARLLVEGVVLDLPARELVVRLDLVRPQPVFLGGIDQRLQLPRRETLVVDVVRLVQALDERELILRIHDLEQLWQFGVAIVRAQHAIAQSVKGAHPHAARADRRQRRKSRQHFLRSLVGEGHCQHGERRRLAGRQQPRDARGQHTRLAAARAGEDQGRRVRQRYGFELFRVEIVEEGRRHGHRVAGQRRKSAIWRPREPGL